MTNNHDKSIDETNNEKNKSDPRKNPKSGYDEKNPTRKDIQDHPEDQNTG